MWQDGPVVKHGSTAAALMLRLRIPQILTANDIMDIRPKTDDDVQGGMMEVAAKNSRMRLKAALLKLTGHWLQNI